MKYKELAVMAKEILELRKEIEIERASIAFDRTLGKPLGDREPILEMIRDLVYSPQVQGGLFETLKGGK